MTPINDAAETTVPPERMRQVLLASSIGTVFEWYDFFIYGALASIVARHFFAALPEAQAFVFTLLTFAVGFVVRPLGALVFGKIGDSRGRKGAFLVTITLMGLATFAIGLLPDYNQIGVAAPVLLIICRMLQGFALGGEYGGAAIYVAEHAPARTRGFNTSWIQSTAAIGLFAALAVILLTRTLLGEAAFADWGWRIPFLASLGLLGVSIWIRMSLEESPAFRRMKAEGRAAERVLAESFLKPANLRLILIALFGVMMAQGVVWYTGHFYAQFFLERIAKVAPATVNVLMLSVTAISAALYVFFGWLSDKTGRKPVMLFGMALMLAAYFPGFHALTAATNPALASALASSPVVVRADPADCTFQLDLTGGARQFATSCDIAKAALAAAGVSYRTEAAPAGAPAQVEIAARAIVAPDAVGRSPNEVRAVRAAFEADLRPALERAGYPTRADPDAVNFWAALGILTLFAVAATALYGPLAATLVELFPTRIRYTAFSFPYHVGTGWFGGLLPATAFAIVAASGDVYAGLWYPAVATAIALVIGLFFYPETRNRDIHA